MSLRSELEIFFNVVRRRTLSKISHLDLDAVRGQNLALDNLQPSGVILRGI